MAARSQQEEGRPAKGTAMLVSSVHWHFTWQRHHEMASRLASRGWDVVYIEPLPKRWPSAREADRVLGRLLGKSSLSGIVQQQESPGVELVSPRLLPDVGRSAQTINRSLFVPWLARRLEKGWPDLPRIVLDYLPIGASVALLKELSPDLAIYDCVWDWPNDPHSDRATIREEDMLSIVDLVFADSPFLYERMCSLHPRVERILPAVDLELYSPPKPSDSERRSSPLCCYFGQIGANVDLGLVRRLSERFRLRLIGPAESSLDGMGDSIEVVGSVPRERLPELLADADVLVLPYRRGGHTQGVIPAKTFECLATGKPTVAIGLPSLDEFGDLFYLCETEAEFIAAVQRAHEEPHELAGPRVEAARVNSWDRRIEEVEQAIESALEAKGGRDRMIDRKSTDNFEK